VVAGGGLGSVTAGYSVLSGYPKAVDFDAAKAAAAAAAAAAAEALAAATVAGEGPEGRAGSDGLTSCRVGHKLITTATVEG